MTRECESDCLFSVLSSHDRWELTNRPRLILFEKNIDRGRLVQMKRWLSSTHSSRLLSCPDIPTCSPSSCNLSIWTITAFSITSINSDDKNSEINSCSSRLLIDSDASFILSVCRYRRVEPSGRLERIPGGVSSLRICHVGQHQRSSLNLWNTFPLLSLSLVWFLNEWMEQRNRGNRSNSLRHRSLC